MAREKLVGTSRRRIKELLKEEETHQLHRLAQWLTGQARQKTDNVAQEVGRQEEAQDTSLVIQLGQEAAQLGQKKSKAEAAGQKRPSKIAYSRIQLRKGNPFGRATRAREDTTWLPLVDAGRPLRHFQVGPRAYVCVMCSHVGVRLVGPGIEAPLGVCLHGWSRVGSCVTFYDSYLCMNIKRV